MAFPSPAMNMETLLPPSNPRNNTHASKLSNLEHTFQLWPHNRLSTRRRRRRLGQNVSSPTPHICHANRIDDSIYLHSYL